MQKLIRKICSKIEQMSIPRVNWIKTLYFNFRLLPFKQAKKYHFLYMVIQYLIPYLEMWSLNVRLNEEW